MKAANWRVTQTHKRNHRRSSIPLHSLVLISLALAFILLGCANAFQEMAQKDTDRAKLHDAKRFIAKGEWSNGINKIAELSTTAQSARDVQGLLASAYAGRCGLDVLRIVDNLQKGQGGRLFVMITAALKGATPTKSKDCWSAEQTLKGIGSTAAARTSSENLLMAFISLAKIGAVVNANGDVDADGTLDVGYNPCTDLPDLPVTDGTNHVDAKEMVTALSLLVTSLAGLSGAWDSSVSSLNTICTALNVAAPGICSTTDAASVTAAQRQAIRGVLVENTSVGLGICVGDAATCAATCDGT